MISRLLLVPALIAALGALHALPAANQTIMRTLVVPVGETTEVDVDYKIGYACDDTSILRAWMTTRQRHNWFVVEGLMTGRTWCRVGTDPTFPSYLFDVRVETPRKPLPRP